MSSQRVCWSWTPEGRGLSCRAVPWQGHVLPGLDSWWEFGLISSLFGFGTSTLSESCLVKKKIRKVGWWVVQSWDVPYADPLAAHSDVSLLCARMLRGQRVPLVGNVTAASWDTSAGSSASPSPGQSAGLRLAAGLLLPLPQPCVPAYAAH